MPHGNELRGREDKQAKKDMREAEANATAIADEEIVRTTEGRPDMRIKENREQFLKDPEAKLDGEPDRRFVENRPDLQAHREATQQNLDNVKEEALPAE